MTAVVVYVLAALTVFAIIRAVTDRNHEYANDLFLLFAVIVAVFWPLYVPTGLLDNAIDWIAKKRAARGGKHGN